VKSVFQKHADKIIADTYLLRGLSEKSPREAELAADFAKADKNSDQAKTFQRQIEELVAKRSRPLYIDAYISANVPEEYVKLRYNLISLLNELESLAGSRVKVRRHFNLEPFSEEASQAEERFGIRKQTFVSQARGAFKEEEFIMGAAFTSGLEKVVVPAFQLGTVSVFARNAAGSRICAACQEVWRRLIRSPS